MVRERLPLLAREGDKVLDIPQATVFRLRERKEVSVLERTYSAVHLRQRQILVRLRKPCSLIVRVALADRPWKEFRLAGRSELLFRVDTRLIGRDCTRVRLDFSEPVGIEEIALLK
jgi:hypothetical protein